MTNPTSPAAAAPTDTVQLVFALHFHQPYGNLDKVFAEATDRCYLRTIDLLIDNPHVITTAHVSGPLLSWLEKHRPEVIDKLASLVERGQVEVLGGGIEEPMLAVLPDRDAVGQLRIMAERCRELLGSRPQGMWLAERVWEPDLPRVIAQAGYHYTLLDDTHLQAAGHGPRLGSYYVTEKAGSVVAIFPIDRGLRTRIPYADLPDLLAYLRKHRGATLTYGDDTEKFGVWPTTEKRVWERRWLEQFFRALSEHHDWLQTVTPTQVMQEQPPAATAYIPTIAYAEMGSWTLPPAASIRCDELRERVEMAGFQHDANAFLRGGIWQAFLAKYPESRLIYRKMLRVSALTEQARLRADPSYEAARKALYQGQCNCAYWHGLFGGLYLQHLRSALMSSLLEAEELIASRSSVAVTVIDHWGNLAKELLLEGPELNAYIMPTQGGSVFELDLRRARFHLTGALGRRQEAYHRDVARAQVIDEDELENISAHDIVRASEPGLADKLIFDTYPRGAFIDHLLPADADPDGLDRHSYEPLCDLANARYQLISAEGGGTGAAVSLALSQDGYSLEKKIAMVDPTHLRTSYDLRVEGEARRVCFASEVAFSLLSAETDGGRRIEVEGAEPETDQAPGARCTHHDVSSVRICADSLGIDLSLIPKPRAELWRIPIETVSQSERGFERSYQGTALVFVWRFIVGGGQPLRASLELALPSASEPPASH